MRLEVVLEQCLAPVPGGTGRYSREIAAALARTGGAADEVTGVVAWHRDLSAARVPGVRGPRRLPLPRRALVAAWERGVGPAGRGDVLLAPTPLWPMSRGPMSQGPMSRGPMSRGPMSRGPMSRGAGRSWPPSVVVVHDAVPWTHPETLTPRGVAWHRRSVESAGRAAALVVVPTRAVADELARVADLPEVLVVGEGVTADLALPADAAARAQRLDLPERYLLTVATLEPRKGLDILLEALAAPGAPPLPLLCAGQPGWGGSDPRALAAAAGLPPERVRVLGRVPDADLAVLLDRATALVVPSRSEGFGLPLLEGMAAGTPVVTSDAPALVEVGGGAARVSALTPSALAGALAEVVADDRLREQMRQAGLARARAYTWDAAAQQLWAALRAVERAGRA